MFPDDDVHPNFKRLRMMLRNTLFVCRRVDVFFFVRPSANILSCGKAQLASCEGSGLGRSSLYSIGLHLPMLAVTCSLVTGLGLGLAVTCSLVTGLGLGLGLAVTCSLVTGLGLAVTCSLVTGLGLAVTCSLVTGLGLAVTCSLVTASITTGTRCNASVTINC